jgi:hypothetical protein
MKADSESFENVTKFKCLRTAVTNGNNFHKREREREREIKRLRAD